MAWFLGLFFLRITVEGSSMVPSFVPGERITAVRRWRQVRVDDVVVIRDPREKGRMILKRCVARDGRNLDLRGDNAGASTDSREFGLVSGRDVRWIVVTPKAK